MRILFIFLYYVEALGRLGTIALVGNPSGRKKTDWEIRTPTALYVASP